MYRNPAFPKINIIAEVHPQFSGDIGRLQTMILQCKLGGADAVKVQLYNSKTLFGNSDRDYVEISKDELKQLKVYCDATGIELFASIFTPDRVDWCEDLGFETYKIASRTVADDPDLCHRILKTNKTVLVSLGMWDWKTKGFPFQNENAVYFYCVSKYPTMIDEIDMPIFDSGNFLGYSDHTIGIGSSVFAVARGAQYIEKHFTLNQTLRFPTEMGHAGSMDLNELQQLRRLADDISLLRKAQAA